MRLDTHREFLLVKGNRRQHHEARLGAALRILLMLRRTFTLQNTGIYVPAEAYLAN